MAAPSLASLPQSLKPILHYLKTAAEHDKRDPVISYYCRVYALQKGLEIDKSSPDARAYLVNLMDYLEKFKSAMKEEEAIQNEVVGQAHVENYTLNMFLYADTEDRAARFSKNVVKSFYTAGMLFDVLSTFPEVGEDIEKNKKYAKWKAAYIHKCLKSGETPIAGPLPEEGEDAEGGVNPGVGFENVSGPSVPPSHMNLPSDTSAGLFPAAGAHAPPSTPQDLPRADNQVSPSQPPNPQRNPQPAPRSVPQPMNTVPTSDWSPPSNPSGVKLSPALYQKGMKYCKYASSAMQYEDSATAIENLTKALKLLTTGQDA